MNRTFIVDLLEMLHLPSNQVTFKDTKVQLVEHIRSHYLILIKTWP